MSSFERFEELNLSKEEIDKLGEALKNEEFRKLLVNYVEEVQNPENQKLYQSEIIELEKERGIDATFINPEPGYVIKTILNGDKKCFINICVNDNIEKPSSKISDQNGEKGLVWSLPHTLSPPREDLDNKSKRCQVYDVVFHPYTLQMAHSNKRFYEMLNTTALEAVEKSFEVLLDKNNIKFPKISYKGLPHASIIRKPTENFVPPEHSEEEKQLLDKIYSQIDKPKQQQQQQQQQQQKKKKHFKSDNDNTAYTTPIYVIKHRSHIDIQEFTESRDAKIHAAIPKELVVEINLPLLKSSSDITLDVSEKTVQLISEKPSKYKLNLTLPYKVNQEQGNAKFDKDLKRLIITLPVRRFSVDLNQDSGVESDHGVVTPDSEEDCDKEIDLSNKRTNSIKFLDDSTTYTLPEFTSHVFDKTIAFTLNVKNVNENSLEKLLDSKFIYLKFTSVSSSYYPVNYAFLVKFDEDLMAEPLVEFWDNNIVLQLSLKENPKSYRYGLDEENLTVKHIEDIIQTAIPEEEEAQEKKEEQKENNENIADIVEKTSAINITTSYESSGDELSCSFSPSKGRGILKRMSSNRYFTGRSISESSLDDFVISSSLDLDLDGASATDNGEAETSSSLKKTVRFSDVIMRQLYRSNSSILGQKKKNQRKARNKKRAHERRHSESEASEIDDKKDDRDSIECKPLKHGGDANDIFHMDMN